MARQTKSESKLTEAADKTAALLQGLQSRLSGSVVTDKEIVRREETPDELDKQLRDYFVAESGKSPNAGDAGVMNQIHSRVIDAVADRILASWESSGGRELGTLERQVIDRLAERILERMSHR